MGLRAALIGCGGLGKVHTQMVQQVGGMTMAAFCDVDGARAEQLRQEFGGDYATSDPEKIFSDPNINVVYICTHHDTHAEFCIRAARAGKHILVEKPLAFDTPRRNQEQHEGHADRDRRIASEPVSYTHLTLPTNREV